MSVGTGYVYAVGIRREVRGTVEPIGLTRRIEPKLDDNEDSANYDDLSNTSVTEPA